MAATLPLTTIFTPPTSCFLPSLSYNSALSNTWGASAGTTTVQNVLNDCFPTGFFSYNRKVVYSPGVCPSAYTMAVVEFTGEGSDLYTAARCCPSGATLITTNLDGSITHCASPATSPVTVIQGDSTATDGSWIIVQRAMEVQWKSGDLNSFTPPSAPVIQLNRATQSGVPTGIFSSTSQGISSPSSSALTSPRTTKAAPASSASSTSTSTTLSQLGATGSKDSLSTGAKAGIGVGVAIGGIIAILLVALIWVRRKKRSIRSGGDSQPMASLDDYHSGSVAHSSDEFHTGMANQNFQPPGRIEGPGRAEAELEAPRRPDAELEGEGRARAELEGAGRSGVELEGNAPSSR